MSRCTITLDTGAIRTGLQKRRESLVSVLKDEAYKLAEDAIATRYGSMDEAVHYESGSLQHRLRRLDSIFIPVQLQHKRRERWPDLQPIYDAMIRRRQHTYQGQYRFWVDQTKLDDLRRRVLERLLRNGLARGTWKIVLKTDNESYVRVEVVKVGRVTGQDQVAARQLTALMRQMFAERASTILYHALSAR